MVNGATQAYLFRGDHPVIHASTIEDALIQVQHLWTTTLSLAHHLPGNLILRMTIGNTEAVVEIVDTKILEQLIDDGPLRILEYIARQMPMDFNEAMAFLEVAEGVVEIETLRVPGDSRTWPGTPGYEPETVMPKIVPQWIRALATREDRKTARGKGRKRTARGRALVNQALLMGERQGWSNAKLARETGIPASTLRDARVRQKREAAPQSESFKTRSPRQRLNKAQTARIIEELSRTENNAAEVARRLGVSARTIRDLRVRVDTKNVATRHGARWTDETRSQVMDLVAKGLTPTEAGREAGVPVRTARGWVRSERKKVLNS